MSAELLARLQQGNLLLGHWGDMAATQARLWLEIENHLWANDLSDMGYSEADVAGKVQAVFTHLYSLAVPEEASVLH